MDSNELMNVAPSVSGLPKSVERKAWQAILHFLGGGAGYLGEWMRRPTQGVADVTDGRQVVSQLLAQKVAEMATADPAIVAAAAEHLLPGYARKLANRFAVAEVAISHIGEEELDGANKEEDAANTAEIDEDWLNSFERFAEDASSEKMRILWGRVLAGEVRKPGSFKKATLRFLYELEQDVADAYERVRKNIVGDSVYIEKPDKLGIFGDLLLMESVGVLTGVSGMLNRSLIFPPSGDVGIIGNNYGLIVFGQPDHTTQVPVMVLTKVGIDLAKLLPNDNELDKIKELAEYFEKNTDNRRIYGCALGRKVKVDKGFGVQFFGDNLLWGQSTAS